MEAVREALVDIPDHRLAGVIAVTDGQVHDAEAAAGVAGPFHVLLTGARGEQDRRLRIVRALSFGMVDKTVTVTIEVVDPAAAAGASTTVELAVEGAAAPPDRKSVLLGRSVSVSVDLGCPRILTNKNNSTK